MKQPSYIVIERETRERMKDASTKRQTYDDLINELLKMRQERQEELELKEQHKKG